MHLRMTGNLLLRNAEAPAGAAADLMHADRLGPERLYEAEPQLRFLRARLELDDGSELLFTDARRFGHAVALHGPDVDDYFASRSGIEPLSDELTPEALFSSPRGERRR